MWQDSFQKRQLLFRFVLAVITTLNTMRRTKEDYIELCEEWVAMNMCTGFELREYWVYDGAEPRTQKKATIIKRKVKREDFKIWE